MPPTLPPIALTSDGCRQRQARLRHHLRQRGLDGALFSDMRYIHYFTGHWQRGPTTAAVFIPLDGPVLLAAPTRATGHAAADECLIYTEAHNATLVDDQPTAALQMLLPRLGRSRRIGCDAAPRPWMLRGHEPEDIGDVLLTLRRTKDADEIVLIRRAIAGCEAAYARMRQVLKPGMMELEVFAQVQATAVVAVAEPIGELGNDFQAGTGGGPPRDRAIEAGELMPLDLSVLFRGYWSDMCRTLCIGGRPSDAQQEARRLVVAVHAHVERTARPGVSCRQLYQEACAILEGQHGWRFGHHLGHGIGLAPHEAPRLNPHWDESLQVGDTLTCEPGLYSPELRGGVRIEQDYLVTAKGLERLTSCSTEL